ncbi:NAD(P)-dependent alcohol dehydrogenase [Devosia salina]|uniref:NAD(P)-dependent alcohol dehydrogenase n=1 Tax=Devosia salina TaxID=2860336 RepID=A0ABX8WNC0_9HYPH|nr:NAD(P)-dependent alcohol dehydrogenase [Devosia salina]QYO78516.1 NAD(P)-dependent alcohol dehydrogenase [Devosia salina]
MRALVYDHYGPPEKVLRLEQVPRPQPRPDEVLVRVHAASLNAWDWDRLVGRPLGRVTDPFRPPHKILGGDIAGVVEALGRDVDAFSVGDAVFGDLTAAHWGGFADYVCAPVKVLARKPAELSFHQAAALPQAGLLAVEAMKFRPNLGAGEHVLVSGAGGGAGLFALQLAKTAGAIVTAVDKGIKGATLLSQGAEYVTDYQRESFANSGKKYDFIIDMVGSQTVFGYRRALAPGGSVVLVGGSLGRILQVVALGTALGRADNQTMGLAIYQPTVAGLDRLATLAVAGTLEPVIDSVFPLEQGPAALRRIGDGDHIGKIIVDMSA